MKHNIKESNVDFIPIQLTITIESEEEFVDIHSRLNSGSALFLAPKGLKKIATKLLSIATKRQINLRPASMMQITVNYPSK